MMKNFILAKTKQNKELVNRLANKVDVIGIHNKMLETQITQVAQKQTSNVAPAGTFPCQPQPNLKGHENAITPRCGKKLEDSVDPRVRNMVVRNNISENSEEVDDKEKKANLVETKVKQPLQMRH